jgi:hypothetical protein
VRRRFRDKPQIFAAAIPRRTLPMSTLPTGLTEDAIATIMRKGQPAKDGLTPIEPIDSECAGCLEPYELEKNSSRPGQVLPAVAHPCCPNFRVCTQCITNGDESRNYVLCPCKKRHPASLQGTQPSVDMMYMRALKETREKIIDRFATAAERALSAKVLADMRARVAELSTAVASPPSGTPDSPMSPSASVVPAGKRSFNIEQCCIHPGTDLQVDMDDLVTVCPECQDGPSNHWQDQRTFKRNAKKKSLAAEESLERDEVIEATLEAHAEEAAARDADLNAELASRRLAVEQTLLRVVSSRLTENARRRDEARANRKVKLDASKSRREKIQAAALALDESTISGGLGAMVFDLAALEEAMQSAGRLADTEAEADSERLNFLVPNSQKELVLRTLEDALTRFFSLSFSAKSDDTAKSAAAQQIKSAVPSSSSSASSSSFPSASVFESRSLSTASSSSSSSSSASAFCSPLGVSGLRAQGPVSAAVPRSSAEAVSAASHPDTTPIQSHWSTLTATVPTDAGMIKGSHIRHGMVNNLKLLPTDQAPTFLSRQMGSDVFAVWNTERSELVLRESLVHLALSCGERRAYVSDVAVRIPNAKITGRVSAIVGLTKNLSAVLLLGDNFFAVLYPDDKDRYYLVNTASTPSALNKSEINQSVAVIDPENVMVAVRYGKLAYLRCYKFSSCSFTLVREYNSQCDSVNSLVILATVSGGVVAFCDNKYRILEPDSRTSKTVEVALGDRRIVSAASYVHSGTTYIYTSSADGRVVAYTSNLGVNGRYFLDTLKSEAYGKLNGSGQPVCSLSVGSDDRLYALRANDTAMVMRRAE